MTDISRELIQKLADAGFKSVVVPADRLSDLAAIFRDLYAQDLLDQNFRNERLAHYTFTFPSDFPKPRSIILTAARQPKQSVEFQLSGETRTAIIPPTYALNTDEEARRILLPILRETGHRLHDAVLPVKSLAVCSGLALYGKNNITYIDEWGSYFRLKAFYTDIPCPSDTWREFKTTERCETCDACIKRCPTGAILSERFLIRAELCLTYLNEGAKEFPEWVNPAWHNCLLGCMLCQDVCPLNKRFVGWIVDETTFSEDETARILEGTPKVDLPFETAEKLRSIDMLDEYTLLGRNLRAVLNAEIESEEE